MQNIYDNDTFFEGYIAIRNRDNNYNVLLEIPAFRSLLPDLAGKDLIDLGCGFGDGCVYYKRSGARRVVGIDISAKMIEKAKMEYAGDGVEYI